MEIEEDYKTVLKSTKSEFPGFVIIQKRDSFMMKAIDVILRGITFGKMKNFMTGFITTIGQKVYVPETWDYYDTVDKLEIIRHERVHMRQARKYGRVLFSIMYLFLPLPGGLAYFRKKFEMEAYEESLRTMHRYLGPSALNNMQKKFIVSQFTSASYFWMWPFQKSVEQWYDSTVEKIKSGK